MNYFEGLWFFLVLGCILLLALIWGICEKPLRWLGLGTSLFMAACILGRRPWEGVFLLAFLAWSFGLLAWYRRRRLQEGREERTYHVALLLALLPLVLAKISPLWHFTIFGFTGISYMSFRVLQILIEMYDGLIETVPFAETLSFLLFFPSMSSGPIDRSRRFHEDWEKTFARREYLQLWSEGVRLLLGGAVYKFILAAWAYKAMGYLDAPESTWLHWTAYAYVYSLYLFFDFAGYSRMAMGAARVLGVKLPDNFREPFLAKDIREFWDRWHITLSHWFRDFVFTRFVMLCSRHKWFKNRLNRACIGFLVNMGIMGMWHGLTLSYILYGLYHGLLLAGTEIFQKKSTFYKTNKDRKWFRALSWFITMQLVVLGLFLFSGKLVWLLGGGNA